MKILAFHNIKIHVILCICCTLGFLNCGTADIWGQRALFRGASPVLCPAAAWLSVSHIPATLPPDATTEKWLQTLWNTPWEVTVSLVKNHQCGYFICILFPVKPPSSFITNEPEKLKLLIINFTHAVQPLHPAECPKAVCFKLTFIFSQGPKQNNIDQEFKYFGLKRFPRKI